MMQLFDAHRHLSVPNANQKACVINGTAPEDWGSVIREAQGSSNASAAIGLHPWEVASAPKNWQNLFLEALEDANAIGEVGLDGLCNVAMEAQIDAFRWQLAVAAERNLPASIHCIKATDPLLRILGESPLPARGFHLHAYAGSAEQVRQFADLGAYFSFHAGQLDDKAKKAPAALRAVPTERLLIETDAPDTLEGEIDYESFLRAGYAKAADLRGENLELLTAQIADNFQRYFLDD